MENCETCFNTGTMEVADTLEVQTGIFVPVRKHGGCDKHPPLGLQTGLDGTISVLVSTGWQLTGHTLVKT